MSRGRHRKPTATDRRAITWGIVGGIAAAAVPGTMPLANAAPTNVWDRIAECESSGNWAIDSGNGYSGGLQFSPSTWAEYGGKKFADDPADASRSEQIQIATSVQKAQGWGAWPVCSKKAGATGTAPEVAPTDGGEEPTNPAPDDSSKAEPDGADAPTDTLTYTVVAGDTLQEIARERAPGTSANDLARASNIVDPNVIVPGDTIRLKSSDSTADISAGSHAATDDAVGVARTWIGTPYSWGGSTKDGVDCSGLVQRVFADVGVTLPHQSALQAAATRKIGKAEAQPGDLVFGVEDGRVHHVGIYLGDGQQIDAPKSGTSVGVHSLYRDQTLFGRVEQ